MDKIYLCQSFMHSWEPTECLGIQILTTKLLLVISIVFGFFGTPCIMQVLNACTVMRSSILVSILKEKIYS
jgi:hypothetical protein